MVLAGLNNNAAITPQTVSDNAYEYFEGVTSKYVYSGGSLYPGIFTSDFLKKYYNCKSSSILATNDTQAFAALAAGKCIIARETGHIVALAPVSAEYYEQGYRFHVLDSTKWHNDRVYQMVSGTPYYHTTLFKSRSEFVSNFPRTRNGFANKLEYLYIIEKIVD